MWGVFAAPHRGHTLRAGASSIQAPARRLRVFDFDFFFLGTAIVGLRNEIRAAPGYRPAIPSTPDGTIGVFRVNGVSAAGNPTHGTPMAADTPMGLLGAELVEGGPALVDHGAVALARAGGEVGAAHRTQAGTVGAAQPRVVDGQ